ncbi:MAG: zf-TFIIB domain-containing protein [Candidatus Poseidoniales archaeon]|nr:zf-TFIIB domain-containing protein [Candidatus Poseidoniales archaeon]
MDGTSLQVMLRRMTIFGLLDILILMLIFSSISISGNDILAGFTLGIGLLLTFYGITATIRFARKQNKYDLKFANLLQFLAGFFLIVGIIQTIIAVLAGNLILIFQGLLLILLGNATRKRVLSIRHPQFMEWYNQGINSPTVLREEEVYASCPNCNSLLAVIPSLLTPIDKCPNCDGLLVKSIEEE